MSCDHVSMSCTRTKWMMIVTIGNRATEYEVIGKKTQHDVIIYNIEIVIYRESQEHYVQDTPKQGYIYIRRDGCFR